MNNETTDYPWALFNLKNEIYAVSSKFIKSIFILEDVISLLDTKDYIRGAVNLRGDIIGLVDTRKFYNMPSVQEETKEFMKIMEERKQDHIFWLNELENSVLENREFKLTTDPHACGFGKWYDSFKTEDVMLEYLLKKFDQPHKKIHQVAKEVRTLEEAGKHKEALDFIEKAKKRELKLMINLFDSLCVEYREGRRELAIVMEDEESKKQMGITVDRVLSIEAILDEDDDLSKKMPDISSESLRLGKRSKNGEPIFLIDEQYFLEL